MWVEGTAQAKRLRSRKKEEAFQSLEEDEDLGKDSVVGTQDLVDLVKACCFHLKGR